MEKEPPPAKRRNRPAQQGSYRGWRLGGRSPVLQGDLGNQLLGRHGRHAELIRLRDPAAAHRLVEVDHRLQPQLLRLGELQLRLKQAALGVELRAGAALGDQRVALTSPIASQACTGLKRVILVSLLPSDSRAFAMS